MMRPRRLGSCLLAASLAVAASAQAPARNVSGGPLLPDQACYDVLRYRLRIAVDPAQKRIDGVLAMRARRVAAGERIALDLDPALALGRVLVDGAAVAAERAGGRFTLPVPVAVGGEFEVEVAYGGAPREARNPPWDGGFTWQRTTDGKPWFATSCQGEGGDLWWPCKDHPSDKPDGFELWCTVPAGLVCASNGVQQGEPTTDAAAGTTTWHWRTDLPIANYNIALNVAPYVELSDTYECIDGTKMPVRFFVLPESRKRAKECMPQFLDHVRVFEELLGPYPFRREKYGLAETPHLGMEHQTIIAYGNGFRDDQYDWLHNHELAHEWWGNLVTCRDWKDMWIHEGFGTYMQPLYREKRFGRKAYDDEVAGYRLMNRTPVAPRASRNSHEIYFGAGGNDIYYKGSHVLHVLRWQLGDERFFRFLRRMCYADEAAAKSTDGSAVRFVDTDDVVRLASEVAGADMTWFFDVYVRQPALPKLDVARSDGTLRLRWQTPDDLPFELAVPLRVGAEDVRVPMAGGVGEWAVGDRDVVVDPDRRLLMRRDPARR